MFSDKLVQRNLIFVCVLAVLGVLGYHVYSDRKPCGQSAAWSGAESSPRASHVHGSHDGYNFDRMLVLIEQTRVSKKHFYDHFRPGLRRQTVVDVKEVRELLSDLYREKVRLQKHLWAERSRYEDGIPLKVKQKIQHYQNVIDSCIGDIEKMLRRI